MNGKINIISILFFTILVSCSNPESDFLDAKEQNTISAYQEFISKHSDSEFSSEAKLILEQLEYENAIKLDSSDIYKMFIAEYPGSKHIANITLKLELRDYKTAQEINTRDSYEEFIKHYPNSDLVQKAMHKIEICDIWSDLIENKNGSYRFYSNSSTIRGKGITYNEVSYIDMDITNGDVYIGSDNNNLFYDFEEKNHLFFFSFSSMRTYIPRINFELFGSIKGSKITIYRGRVDKRYSNYNKSYIGETIDLNNQKLVSHFFTKISSEISELISKEIKENNISNHVNYDNNIALDFNLTSGK